MSASRRAAMDINILETLDGLGTRPRSKRAVLWGGAGVLACGLVGTLVWLAHDSGPEPIETVPVPIAAASALPGTRPESVAPAAARVPAPVSAPVIAPVVASVSDSASVPASAPAAATPPAAPAPHALPIPKHRPAAHPHPAASTASHVPPVRQAVDRTHPNAAHAAVKRATPAGHATGRPAVDTDVALISAIIKHVANEREAAADSHP